MDRRARKAYVPIVFGRFITMLAVLSIALVATASAVHAARASTAEGRHHTMPAEMHALDKVTFDCQGDHCGSDSSAVCEFVCAGLQVIQTMADGDAAQGLGAAVHGLSSAGIHDNHTPGRNERPPKLRLL